MDYVGTLVESKNPRSQTVLLGGVLESCEHFDETCGGGGGTGPVEEFPRWG